MRNRRSAAASRWVWPVLGLAAATALTGSLTARFLHIRAERVADALAWTLQGPPCPTLTEAELTAQVGKGLRSFEYGDATFFRRDGDVECAPVYEDGGRGDAHYPVCRFTGPGVLRIRTAQGEWRFRPGPGRPAAVPGGQAGCVLDDRGT